MKFEATVLEWGPDALMFTDDPENPFLVLFGENAPEALREMSVVHNGLATEDPAVGDTFVFGDLTYKITAVGEEAKTTIKSLGHCTIKFNNSTKPDLPGCIHVDGKVPTAEDIKIGMKISIG